MAIVTVIYTATVKKVYVTQVQHTAAHLKWLGEHARPCPTRFCKRPEGHHGDHLFSEDTGE